MFILYVSFRNSNRNTRDTKDTENDPLKKSILNDGETGASEQARKRIVHSETTSESETTPDSETTLFYGPHRQSYPHIRKRDEKDTTCKTYVLETGFQSNNYIHQAIKQMSDSDKTEIKSRFSDVQKTDMRNDPVATVNTPSTTRHDLSPSISQPASVQSDYIAYDNTFTVDDDLDDITFAKRITTNGLREAVSDDTEQTESSNITNDMYLATSSDNK